MILNGKRIPFNGEARHGTNAALGEQPRRFASGGKVHQRNGKVKMTAGAGSGEGRLQKIKAYGGNAKP